MTDPKPNLSEIRDTSCRAKDLIKAAVYLTRSDVCPETGPMEAVLEAALAEARKLDTMIDTYCEAEGE